MNIEALKDEIISLIVSQREDDYWDFKQSYHENKADLLHDIICMANNRSNRDGYIIFGVQDKTFDIIGVEEDNNRKNQQNLIDFLKGKAFSMGVRPKIQLFTFNISQHEIDVLIVYNTLETPYYLISDYRDQGRNVRANYIYTRVGDTNTDINKSADPNHVEYLWKKRFGLHLSPFEKLKLFLNTKNDWIVTEDIIYHKNNPEYTLVKTSDYDRDSAEFYAYVLMDSSVRYGNISANYFGTTLYSHQTVILDGGRYVTVAPEWGHIHHDKYHREFDSFKYFIKQHVSYALHRYLLNEESHEAQYAHRRFMEVVLLFENDDEKDYFIDYVGGNLDVFEKLVAGNSTNYDYLEATSQEKKVIIRRLKVAKALKEMQLEFNEI